MSKRPARWNQTFGLITNGRQAAFGEMLSDRDWRLVTVDLETGAVGQTDLSGDRVHLLRFTHDGQIKPLLPESDPFDRIPSPDGQYVAVVGKGVYTRDGALATEAPHPAEPVWAPDSRKLVYLSGHLVTLPDGKVTKLDLGPMCAGYVPVHGFSPDSRILYHSLVGCI